MTFVVDVEYFRKLERSIRAKRRPRHQASFPVYICCENEAWGMEGYDADHGLDCPGPIGVEGVREIIESRKSPRKRPGAPR